VIAFGIGALAGAIVGAAVTYKALSRYLWKSWR
jgi:hypothetical protein